MAEIIIYNTNDGKANIKFYTDDGTAWLTQAQIAELFDKNISTISRHISNILKEKEVDEKSNLRFMQIANSDKPVAFYSLDVILAVGFRVRSPRGTQFRQWTNSVLKEYLEKGFILDKDRLKNPDGRPDYFDELLEQIRDIRASEKRFYQKLRDLFALSTDYSPNDEDTQTFYAITQNKLIYGVTGKTAAEIIASRADHTKQNMGLTSWQGSIVRKADIYVSKNYLTSTEIDTLNSIVSAFLESAELRVKIRKTLTLDYWRNSVDNLLIDHDIPVLKTTGKISKTAANQIAANEYIQFDQLRKEEEARRADEDDWFELEASIKNLKK